MPIGRARLRISDYNAQRKANNKGKEHKVAMVSLSLTSMVDMFAILVIFLLTSSGEVTQWIQIGHSIDLPKARHSDAPQKAANLQISVEGLFVDDKLLVELKQMIGGPQIIQPLKKWLAGQDKKDGFVNIVGDTRIPFGVVRRIVSTCQEAGFGNVNLAVQPKGGPAKG
jgi:biopolymer transport protein TolR